MESDKKVFNDPIHGNIQLPAPCVKIIDTPEFQRLRFIKQLGGAYFVYPGAAHNRFEHSIGTCHLAGRLVRALQHNQPELELTPNDVLCVEIAALCHDLGHGPFSHLFDAKVIPQLQTDEGKKWKHEQGSIDMFNYMLKKNDGELREELRNEFEKEYLSKTEKEKEKETNANFSFIEEMIIPKDPKIKEWEYEGRPKEKAFLYEIVSNKRNGIDVDKWDYFARDCHMLGIGNNFNYNRCIDFCRVIDVDGDKQICFRDKEAGNLYDMFHTRYLLHRRAYQHKTNNIIERMLAEALVEANDFIELPKENGKTCKMLQAVEKDNMDAYRLLTDDVIFRILGSSQKLEKLEKLEKLKLKKPEKPEKLKKLELELKKLEKLENSKKIIERVLRRDLYPFVGEERFPYKAFENENDVKEDMKNVTGMDNKDDIIIDVVDLNYGKKDKNPIDEVHFYNKRTPKRAEKIRKEDVSFLLPADFAEQLVRVYSRSKEPYEDVKKVYNTWRSKTEKRNTNENGKRKQTSEERQGGQRKKTR